LQTLSLNQLQHVFLRLVLLWAQYQLLPLQRHGAALDLNPCFILHLVENKCEVRIGGLSKESLFQFFSWYTYNQGISGVKISKELGDCRLEFLEIRSKNGQQRLPGDQNYGIQSLQKIQ